MDWRAWAALGSVLVAAVLVAVVGEPVAAPRDAAVRNAPEPAPVVLPEPPPPEARAIVGVVVDRDGPVAGARVLLDDAKRRGPLDLAPSDVTGADGRFRLAGVPPGEQRVRVERPDGAVTFVRAAVSEEVVAPFGEAVVTGDAFDQYGAPADDVKVRVTCAHPLRSYVRYVTVEEGRFRIEGLSPGLHTFWPAAFGTRSPVRAVVAEGGTAHVVIDGPPENAVVWSGTVRTRDGEAVAGAELTLLSRERDERVCHVARTDDQGAFRLAAPVGRFRVHLQGSVPAEPQELEIAGPLRREVILPGGTLRGRVEYGAHPPPAGAFRPKVRVRRIRPAAADRHALEVRPDGTFEAHGLPPGRYVLQLIRQLTPDVNGDWDRAKAYADVREEAPADVVIRFEE